MAHAPPDPELHHTIALSVLELCSGGIWAIDPDGVTTFANQPMAEMLGYTVDEMLGRSVFDFMSEEEGRAARLDLARRNAGIVETHGFTFQHRDGTALYALLETSPLRSATGEIIGALALVKECGARCCELLELERTRRMLVFAEATGRLGAWEWDIERNHARWSAGLWALFGRSPDSTKPSLAGFLETVHPDDQLRVSTALNGRPAGPFELRYRALWPDGQARWLHTHGHLEHDPGGLPLRAYGVTIDVTEQVLEQRRQEQSAATRRHQQNLELLGSLAAGVAHEINNPLQAIATWTELVLSETHPDQIQASARIVLDEAARIADIVSALLGVSRQGAIEGPVDVAEAVSHSLLLLRSSLRDAGVLVEVQIEAGLRAALSPNLLQQVLLNLLSNARDAITSHAGDERRIWIEATEHAEHAEITVRDTGPGIPDDALARVFEPFFTTKSHRDSVGLGLHICHDIVEGAGGTMHVRSGRGGPTTFTVRLPRECP